MKQIARHIIAGVWASMATLSLWGQAPQTEPLMPGEKPKPTKYVATIDNEKQHLVFFQGFTLSVDVYGPVAYAVSDYGTAEAALRLNLKNTFFPIFEAGYGKCKKDDFNTKVIYKVNAPYMRIGLDINMLKDKFQHNRLYLGARYGFSSFQYDISGPELTDPYWGGSEAFSMKGISCNSHWAELVFGAEVRIFRNFHMGWAVRYKREIGSTKSDYAKPSCIPGYGYTTNATCWGATYNLIFDLNWGLKKSRKKGVNMEVREIQPVPEHTDEPSRDESDDSMDGQNDSSSEGEHETDENNETDENKTNQIKKQTDGGEDKTGEGAETL